ncbi:peptide/nickel ABC transporter, ATP-binding protein [Deferribacter desulfuricans SSM1]|uniref:Peptide/nickel ABC transporter, ATP-binding protein n=1 Tax=Deferribacter desulfuricans (strain DSM 14783 / JCM 11476 / NBRC 101012 / SSM1) TaxID=639282 RepID=D3P9X4_DEFDS|nr:ABC transporter ATP-binding protein [Deferribacter desulfuricans]BAI81514.1 peptide/nickel ABC transporter, ATP-binding protein [Deferribacter desulfuricans SSM1]
MLLSVRNLKTIFETDKGVITAVNGVSFDIDHGKTLCLVGESGSGKSITSMSIMRLIDKPGKIAEGEIILDGVNLVELSEKQMRQIRGKQISMIFQEPMTSLNPSYTVGYQIKEVLKIHQPHLSKKEIHKKAVESLELVGIPSAEDRLKDYPFKLSGGLRQRVMIAMAMACEPELLIADEPTTALDVTIQAQVLSLMKELQRKKNTSILFITHDLGVVYEMADDVAVMYTGFVVEKASKEKIFDKPFHPYTEGLIKSIPSTTSGDRKTKLYSIKGNVPSLYDLPRGCTFWPRCPCATKMCKEKRPELKEIEPGHFVACFKAEGLY